MVCPHVCNVTTVVTVHSVIEPRIVVKKVAYFVLKCESALRSGRVTLNFLGSIQRGDADEWSMFESTFVFISRSNVMKEGEHSTGNFEEIFENKVYIFNSKRIKTKKLELGLDLRA